MQLTPAQREEIRNRLAQGMTPVEVADFFGRVADLDLGAVVQIRSAAYDIAREMAADREAGDAHGG